MYERICSLGYKFTTQQYGKPGQKYTIKHTRASLTFWQMCFFQLCSAQKGHQHHTKSFLGFGAGLCRPAFALEYSCLSAKNVRHI